MSAKTSTAEKLTSVLTELHDCWIVFDAAGGRGVELAERIDYLTRRQARLAAQLKRENPAQG
jgi:hypothetical protein